MARARFVADGIRIGLSKTARGRGTAGRLEQKDGPLVVNVVKSSEENPDPDDDKRIQAFAELTSEQFAISVARLLNAAMMTGVDDLQTASRTVEVMLSQLLSDVVKSDPGILMESAIHYVFQQENWDLDVEREEREDGIRFHIVNRHGPRLPYSIFLTTRGKTPAFWIMQDARIIQGTHAYKIPIQAATALKHELADYIRMYDVGGLVKSTG